MPQDATRDIFDFLSLTNMLISQLGRNQNPMIDLDKYILARQCSTSLLIIVIALYCAPPGLLGRFGKVWDCLGARYLRGVRTPDLELGVPVAAVS